MPLRVQCPAGHLMMVPDHRAGTVLRCPNCGIDVQVPAAPGSAAKDAVKPRISTPVLAGRDAKPGLAAPNLSKPRTKLPTVGEAKPKALPEVVEEVVALEAAPLEPQPLEPAREVSEPVAAPPIVVPPPHVTPEIVFTTPVVATPTPLATAPPVVDQSTIETVELPPKKIPPRETTPPAPTYAKQRDSERKSLDSRKDTTDAATNRPRVTLTGTMVAAPTPAAVAEPLFEINDEIVVPAPVAPAPVVAPHVIDAEVLPAAPVAPPAKLSMYSAATEVDPQRGPDHEPTPPPRFLIQGVRPTSSQQHTVWQLAAALFAATLLSIGPSLWEITDYMRSEGEVAVARWAFLLLLLGVIQLGSIVLLVQVPDWSSVWIVTLQSLALAALYAAVLGLTVITSGNSTLISTLDLNQQYSTGKAPPWCICLAATYACLAFFAGRFSAKWRKVLRQVEANERAAAAHA